MKNPYQVMFIEDDKIIYESFWIMAKDSEAAKRIAIAAQSNKWNEEVRVLCRPF